MPQEPFCHAQPLIDPRRERAPGCVLGVLMSSILTHGGGQQLMAARSELTTSTALTCGVQSSRSCAGERAPLLRGQQGHVAAAPEQDADT